MSICLYLLHICIYRQKKIRCQETEEERKKRKRNNREREKEEKEKKERQRKKRKRGAERITSFFPEN